MIRHIVDGAEVLAYEKPQYDEGDSDARKLIRNGDVMLGEGYLALQAERPPHRVPQGGDPPPRSLIEGRPVVRMATSGRSQH